MYFPPHSISATLARLCQIVTSERIELDHAGDESPWSFKCFSLLQNPRRQLQRVYELITQLRAQIHEHCRIAEVWAE